MKKSAIISLSVLSFAVVALLSTSLAYAQVTVLNPPGPAITNQLPPQAAPQAQSAIPPQAAPNQQAPPGQSPQPSTGAAKADAVLNQVQQTMKAHPGTTADQVLQQLTDQGIINCPAVKNPHAHACILGEFKANPHSPITPPVVIPP